MAKKYEFTGETKEVFGVTLKRIRALVAFGTVTAGSIGGWIEDDRNLSHDGEAWVYGEAQVYGESWVCGKAQVSGEARVSTSPINIIGLTYVVTVTDGHMQCGCEIHEIAEWSEFGDARIARMDGVTSARFWRDHKALLLGLCAANGRPLAKKEA